tara:strand:+ start:253 stop:624 length:372 start_codon:yes stop_codon:yes gene_type:complete
MTTKSDTIKKRGIIDALEKSLGVVTTACKNVGIARSTFYEWYNKDDEFRKQVNSIQDLALDFAESQLHKQIQDGSTSATIFYLKTKGKKRGYIERHEITGAEGEDLNLRIEIIDKIVEDNTDE